jgi:small subunit ribosomal protein S17
MSTAEPGPSPEPEVSPQEAPAPMAASKSTAPAKAAAKAGTAPSDADAGARTGRRKVREGIVASNAMDKTAVVVIVERVRHARYAKTVQRTKRLYAHDEVNDVRVGDRVRLVETRPLSKLKRWRVEQVLERAR